MRKGTVACGAALTGAARALKLIDVNITAPLTRAQAADILHAAAFAAPVRTHAGSSPDLGAVGGILTPLHPSLSREAQAGRERSGALLPAAPREAGS